jgi:hypothetical protein
MAGATSIIQLILKKWGDDAAGAAKELEEKVGFPESVANRIATGELPMDEASRLKRWQEQNYGDELYHGSTHEITEFNGQGSPSNDWGQGTYLSDSVHDSSKNYAGEGPDLTGRLYRRAEEMWLDAHDFSNTPDGKVIGGKKFTEDEWRALDYEGKQEYLREDARKELKGPNNGVIYPVRVKQDGLLNTYDEVELPDYYQRAVDELDYDYHAKNGTLTPEMEDEIYEQMSYLEEMDGIWRYSENPNANLFTVGNEYGADMSGVSRIEEGDTWERVRENMGEAAFETEEGEYMGAGGVLAEVMRRGGAKGVVDDVAPQRFPTMEAGQHTVIFPGNESQIRSVNAAFDPEYTGSNIMGNATVPMLATTAALAAAPAVVGGVFQHSATKEPVVKKRNNQSSLLESVTDFNDEVIDSVKHAAGPLSLLMPYEGINDYLKVVNDNDKQPTWMDRLGLFDF